MTFRAKRDSVRLVLVLTGLCLGVRPAEAQDERPEDGLRLALVSVGGGYAFVQLPPVTLSGTIPQEILQEDLIATTQVGLRWLRPTPRSQMTFTLDGTYVGRIKYSEISAFGGGVAFGASRQMGRFRLSTNATSALTNGDHALLAPTSGQQLVASQDSFDELSRSVAHPRSRHPDPVAASLFVPISTSALVLGEGYGHQMLGSGGSVGLTYSTSRRASYFVDAGFSSVRAIGLTDEPAAVPFVTAKSRVTSGGVTYTLGRRSEITGSVSYGKSLGTFRYEATQASVRYGWTGRRWFYSVLGGVARRSDGFLVPADLLPRNEVTEGLPPLQQAPRVEPTYRLVFGIKTNTQTFLVGHTRAPNDSQGYGSLTGLVVEVDGAWYWAPRQSKWDAHANLLVHRVPGNFLYIYSWLGNAGIGRILNPTMRLTAEMLYDRHGSKGFEGFHLGRQAFTINLVWNPNKRLL